MVASLPTAGEVARRDTGTAYSEVAALPATETQAQALKHLGIAYNILRGLYPMEGDLEAPVS